MSVSKGSSMGVVMLITMLIMVFGFWAYAIAVSLARVRSVILEREREATWVSELAEVRR